MKDVQKSSFFVSPYIQASDLIKATYTRREGENVEHDDSQPKCDKSAFYY